MYNKSQLSRDKKNAKKQVSMPNPFGKDVPYVKPIVSQEGFKQGPPPAGSKYRIIGEDESTTLYNPTPYTISVEGPNGSKDVLNPFDTTPREYEESYMDETEEGGEYLELDKDQIAAYRAGGYVVEELPEEDNGGVYSQDIPYPPKHNPANSFAVNDPRSMQKGGSRQPIYVTDPNDPRLLAHNDSLSRAQLSQYMMNYADALIAAKTQDQKKKVAQKYIQTQAKNRYSEKAEGAFKRHPDWKGKDISSRYKKSWYDLTTAEDDLKLDDAHAIPYKGRLFIGLNEYPDELFPFPKQKVILKKSKVEPTNTKPDKSKSDTKPKPTQQRANMVKVDYPTDYSKKSQHLDENGNTVTETVYYDVPKNTNESFSFTPPPINDDLEFEPPVEAQSTNLDPWNDVEAPKKYPKAYLPNYRTGVWSATGRINPEQKVKELKQLDLKGETFEEGGSIMDLDLTEEEIEQYRRGGYIVEELPTAQDGIKTLPEVTVTPGGYKGPTNLDPVLANALLNTPQVQQKIALAKGKGPTAQGAKAIKSSKAAQDRAKFDEQYYNQMQAKADWEKRSSGAAQPVDEVWQLPLGLRALGTIGAIDIPYLGASVGELGNLAGMGYGATQLPGTAKSWYDYGKGDVSLREAIGKTALNSLDFLGARTGYNTAKNLIGTERGLMSIGKGFKPAALTREEAMANLSNPELYNALDRRTELITRDPAYVFSKDAKELGLRGIGDNVDFKRSKKLVKAANDEVERLQKLYDKSGTSFMGKRINKDKALANELLNATSNKVKTNYEVDQFWKQRSADRLRLPINLKSTSKVGEGAFTEVYPTTFDENTLVKIGNVPQWETPETMQHIVNVGKELNNPRLGLPFKTVNFGEPYRAWNTDTQSEIFKPSKLYAQLMRRVPGRPGIPFNPSQQAVEEYIDMIKELEKRNIHLDYINTQNTMYDDATDQFSIIDVNTTPDDMFFLENVNNVNNWESELRNVYKDAMRAPNPASERFKAKADEIIRTPLNFNEEFEEGGTSEPPVKTLPEVTVRPKTLGSIVDSRPEYTKGYYDPWGVSDNTLENVLEIFDPTGMTSWDDVVRAEREFGKDSWQANLERLGAMPFLGKAAKTLKGVRGLPMTARQARNYNTTVKGLQGTSRLGRGSDAYQAADEFGTGGSYVDNQMTHFQNGGNMDPGNNALELHMFYDKDVYKKQKGGNTFQPGQIYTYDENPGVFYKLDNSGNIVVKNKEAGSNEYVAIKDPKGTRRKTLEYGLNTGSTNLYGTPEQYAEYSNKGSAINDFFFSENEAAKQLHQSNAEQCLKDSPNCLSSTWLYYDRHLAPNLGLPSSWQLKENAGIYSGPKEKNSAFPKYGESADSWDIARAIIEGQGKSYYAAKDDAGAAYPTKKFWKDLNLPVGAIINAGSKGGGLKYGKGDTYNEGAGLVPSNHSAMVVGYDAEGIPYIYDYGKIVKATDPNALINGMGITNITAPKELTGQTYANLKKQNKLKDEITDLKFNISDDSYNQISDIDEYKPFIKNLESNKSEIMSALGISNKTYDEYAKRAAAIALTETGGGNDASIRWKGIIPVPSYITDKIGFGSSQGITQINTDVLFSSDKTKKQMNALGITKDNYDPYNSKHIAAATMIMLADADKVAMANLKKHSSNKQDLNPAAATYYQWNSPSALVKGEAQGDNLNVKRFMQNYNMINNTFKKDGGAVEYLTQKQIDRLRAQGYHVVEE